MLAIIQLTHIYLYNSISDWPDWRIFQRWQTLGL